MYSGTTDRIGNDNTTYIDSIAPHNFPGGGLFSITIFTLNGLYELHQKGRNWWTTSNCNLPLIRYFGCTIKLYASTNTDYVVVPIRCGDLKATEQTFQSCQPSVLGLNKNKKIMLCKENNYRKKPIKKFFVKPPALLMNKWYFQKDFANYPLLMILAAAASYDRYYIPASAISNTIGITLLNTTYFTMHGFKTRTTSIYTPNKDFILMGIITRTKSWENATLKDCTLLGNTKDYFQGESLPNNDWDTYLSTPAKWGNPFHPYWFKSDIEEGVIFHIKVKNNNPKQTLKDLEKESNYIKDIAGIAKLTKPLTLQGRYNPQQDMGHNATFLTRITQPNEEWHTPKESNIIVEGYPLWLLFWGWHDYIAKAKLIQNMDTDYINVIVSDYIHESPKQNNMTYYVPLDWFMLDGRSPYGETQGDIKTYDHQNWHPKANFQILSISEILQTGPATPKLPPKISTEAHFTYKFHFKVGGCPPSMDEVCNPAAQPSYPQPGNLLSSILLQNPEYPIQYYISSFDQRRHMLTERAAKRLKEDKETKEYLFKSPGQTLLQVQTKSPQETSEESSSEEESEKTLEQQLHKQRRRQRKLQYRILNLLAKLESTIS